ncbi:actin-like protein, putative [Plasmodium chabaudi chabaudi]|uniref:Actin-like protein, putative n=1 Tax=Plasmodium chabaudi chabaudi TaxID=31271 RepID=A0A4V0K230_PLACU|nr:actin-like protein, putative [Plasmodium chabaudi chabaudi]VTZ66885.1 actin-like protein, putative [Plasmodium chabaudi chabaudi]|eukprot:XP_016653099.1 actin-like protein, putative [Plasmodium chabaudi chabaudi]
MEIKSKKYDNENDYKYYILQIGRKYTYVGFSGLHKPISVFNTPNFFIYNENFHNCVNDENQFDEVVKGFSKMESNNNGVPKEETKLKMCKIKKEDTMKRENSSGTDKTSDYGINELFENDDKIYDEVLETYENNENMEKMKESKIYHYEYKYNQDINLWNKFFEEFCFQIFDKIIKTSNKAKKVIVVMNMFIPTIIRYSLCKCLIENLNYYSISYINDLVSPLFLCNCNTCLVIDLGYLNCRLLPIMNGLPLYHHYTYVYNGGFYINQEIKRLLKEQYIKGEIKELASREPTHDPANFSCENKNDDNEKGEINMNNCNISSKIWINENESENIFRKHLEMYDLETILNIIENISDDEIETIKIKYCYLKNEETKLVSDKYILYKLENGEIIITPETRWKACEILFNKKNDQNIYSLLSNILNKLNTFEVSVFQNILLVGGCSNIKGIVSKIAKEFSQIIRKKNTHTQKNNSYSQNSGKNKKIYIEKLENNMNFIFPKIAPNLRQFIGASICSNLENLPDYNNDHIYNNILYDHLNEDVYMTFKR